MSVTSPIAVNTVKKEFVYLITKPMLVNKYIPYRAIARQPCYITGIIHYFPPSWEGSIIFLLPGKVQHRLSSIHGLPVTLRMLRVKSNRSDWLRVRNEFPVHVQRIGPGHMQFSSLFLFPEAVLLLVSTKRAGRDQRPCSFSWSLLCPFLSFLIDRS